MTKHDSEAYNVGGVFITFGLMLVCGNLLNWKLCKYCFGGIQLSALIIDYYQNPFSTYRQDWL